MGETKNEEKWGKSLILNDHILITNQIQQKKSKALVYLRRSSLSRRRRKLVRRPLSLVLARSANARYDEERAIRARRGENLAEARALCERLDETLKNCASKLVGDVSTRRVTELEERVKEMEEELREKEEELREVKEELRNLSSTPLWKVVTDKQYKDIFETHILSKLEELDFRVFREVNT